jgi:hypothetical protein
MLGIAAQSAADGYPDATRMLVVPVASFSSSIHKAGSFQIANQFSDFSGHIVL